MPRKCTGCDYTTDDPFLGTCPWCAKSLAIVSRGGNRESARVDWRRERAGRRVFTRPAGGWLSAGWGVWLMVAVVVGGLFFAAAAGGRRDGRPRNAAPAARVKIGMSVRDAVLALEPTPTADGRVSLHDLLDAGPDVSGSFTYCDNSPLVRVTFRNGRVTGVSETGGRFRARHATGGHSARPRCPMSLTWQNAREIGEALFERYDTLDPLTVRFTDLHKWVLDVEGFEGQPDGSSEKVLEAIQMAWYEEWKDEYGGAGR